MGGMSQASRVADYIEGLRIGQGRYAGDRFRLLGWQRRFLRGAFSGPGDGAISMGRGGGKSTFVASIGAAAVDVGGPLVEPMAETVIVASSFDQGVGTIWRHALHFLRPSLERYGVGKRGRFRLLDSSNRALVADKETGATLRVLGSDPRRMHGLQPRLLLLDEPSQWPESTRDRALAALKTSRGKIPDSKALWLGTRPSEADHPFQRALDGHGVRFALSYAAPEDDPPFQKRTWVKANPSLRHGFPDLEDAIRSEAADARHDPDALASFRSLRLNQGTSDVSRSVLVDAATWARAEQADGERTGPYVLGLDLGQNRSMSAAAGYWQGGLLDGIGCFPEHPTLQKRGLAHGVGRRYVDMHNRDELILRGERVSGLGQFLDHILGRWGRPAAIVVDRWRRDELLQALEARRIRAPLVTRGMGFKDGAEDVRSFRAAVLGGRVRPVESLLLRSAMLAAELQSDPAGNRKVRKRTGDDAAVAAVLAVGTGFRQWQNRPQRQSGAYLGLV